MFDDVRRVVGLAWRELQGARGKGWRLLSSDDHVDDVVTIVHLQEVDGFEVWFKLLSQDRRVVKYIKKKYYCIKK